MDNLWSNVYESQSWSNFNVLQALKKTVVNNLKYQRLLSL
jgi:hypothetical protein